jgi:hypothetical protein
LDSAVRGNATDQLHVPSPPRTRPNTPNEREWRFDVASIRALPGTPGDFCWNQAVLHWGSKSSRFAPHPRLSMALEFQRGDVTPFNKPLVPPSPTKFRDGPGLSRNR